MVAPTWDLMSSPMIGRPRSAKRCCQYGSRPMKTGMQLTNAQPGVKNLLDVPLGRLLAAHGQIVHHDIGPGVLEDLHDVGGWAGGFGDLLLQVFAQTVVRHAAMDRHAQVRHVGELDGVVLARPDRFAQVFADFFDVDVKRGAEFNVTDVIIAQTGRASGREWYLRASHSGNKTTLNERISAVADANNRNADFLGHRQTSIVVISDSCENTHKNTHRRAPIYPLPMDRRSLSHYVQQFNAVVGKPQIIVRCAHGG